ncbi:hypothetical protein C9J98_03430 [Stenotrophomonas panacihumi]|nr:hypothetical protein C9J98_03430 [Stenotrophomonas panacihumi]
MAHGTGSVGCGRRGGSGARAAGQAEADRGRGQRRGQAGGRGQEATAARIVGGRFAGGMHGGLLSGRGMTTAAVDAGRRSSRLHGCAQAARDGQG